MNKTKKCPRVPCCASRNAIGVLLIWVAITSAVALLMDLDRSSDYTKILAGHYLESWILAGTGSILLFAGYLVCDWCFSHCSTCDKKS